MTYRELINQLLQLSDEQLNSDVTLYVGKGQKDEWYPAHLKFASQDILDENHPFFTI
jgi:hypothetical protein